MKVFKGVLYGLWAWCVFVIVALGISWISGAENVLAWGYLVMIALPVTGVVTAIYWLINKIFPGGKLY